MTTTTSGNLSGNGALPAGVAENWVSRWRKPRGARAMVLGFLLLASIFSITLLVYGMGGTRYVWAHLMYLPIILAAAGFGIYGGISAALLGSLLLGPYMPMDVAAGTPQTLENWVFRVVFFILVGAFCGLISRLLNKQIDQLKATKEQIQYILNNTREVIFQIDLKGNYIYGNNAAEEMTGYPLSELLQMNMMQLAALEHHPLIKDHLQRQMSNLMDEKAFEIEIQHKDGRKIWTELTTRGVYDRDKKLVAIQGVARDVSERRQTAETIALFRALVDRANDSIEVIDPLTGRFVDVNEKAGLAHGYTREEYLALTVFDLDPQLAANGKRGWDAHIAALQKFGFLSFESEHRRKDGSIFPVEISVNHIHLERDYLLAVVRDITDRKQAEAMTERERQFITTMFESMPGVVYLYNDQGKFLRWNRNFEKVSGYSAEEIARIHPLDFFAAEEKKLVQQRIGEVLSKGESFVEASFVSKDGHATPYFFTGSRIMFDGMTCVIGMGIDMTERRALETQLRQSQKMLAIGQLAGGVAHDFNNILAVIQMQTDLMKATCKLSTVQTEFAEEIAAAAQRAAALTRQLLLFSRKETVSLIDMDLNQSINDLTKMLRRTIGADIQVQFKFAMEPMYIHADAGMMDQVLMNLAVNARDAMPRGGKLIIETSAVKFDEATATQSDQMRPGYFVCLTVSDTGCGIPPENLQRIFEPFFTTKEVGRGTGLGLATVFGIVQQHQGWITVYSEIDRGTTFRIFYPRLGKTPGQNSEQPTQIIMRGKNELVLLVEDDAFLRASVSKTLSQLAYRVIEAANGPEALEIWNKHRDEIRLLLTDMVMPGGLTGLDLGEQFLKEKPDLKVIYSSGYSPEVASKNFPLKEGVNFLTKPYQTARLSQALRARLNG
ncbi:MAG TPA: PAS domain S-box protein [Verrucomicrobiae bacterium]|jgi:PAS domain S-box-containing protein